MIIQKKQPDEILPIIFDFAEVLGTGDTITAKTISALKISDTSDATSTIVHDSDIVGNTVVVAAKAGTDLEDYKITCLVDTTLLYKYEKDIRLVVRSI